MSRQYIRHLQTVVFYICKFQEANGYSPAAVDIAQTYGVHGSTASKWLCQLEGLRIIKRHEGIRQHIEVRI